MKEEYHRSPSTPKPAANLADTTLGYAAKGILSGSHSRMLYEESGISPDVAAERGYYTARRGADVPEAFANYQRKPGLVAPMFSPDGASRGVQLRPDRPRKDKSGKPLKYETPSGVSPIVDVHPRMLDEARNGIGPLVITEGAKTGDAFTSRGVCTVVLAGVWMWCVPKARPYRLKPCFDHIRLEDRDVFVAFDSDCMAKASVQEALEAVVPALEARGARVRVVYLPSAPDGSKQGLDDFLAVGGTVREVFALARKFDPADLGRIRLSRDEKLRAAVADLWRGWHDCDWMHFRGAEDKGNWQRGHTARDVKAALIGLVPSIGKPDARGVVVEVGSRRLAERSAKSSTSACAALKHLAADGQLEILPAADKAKPRRYRLLVPDRVHSATLCTMERGEAKGTGAEERVPRCKGLRYPSSRRLRWSSPARSGRLVRRVDGLTGRTVTEAIGDNVFVDPDYRPYAKRLGPHRCAVLDVLEAAGGEMHLKDLCEALHRKRPWDVRRRILEPLKKAGIIEMVGDIIRLARWWQVKLEERREEDGEVEQADKQAKRHRTDWERYRMHLERQKHGTPKASLEAVKRTRELRKRRIQEACEEVERRRAPVDPALRALVERLVKQNGRIRMGLLCGVVSEEGLRGHDVPRAVEALGCRVEVLPEYGNQRFVFAPRERALGA